MSSKKYSNTKNRRFKTSTKTHADSVIIKKAEKQGVRIYPSAVHRANVIVRKSVRSGGLKTRREKTLGQSALMLAGVKVAKLEGKKIVKATHINKGWQTLRKCPGNVPPHKCMKRSVINVESELKRSLPGLKEIMDSASFSDED